MIVASAIGRLVNVKKNKLKPNEPASPRVISQGILLPKNGILRALIIATQMERETRQRNKTSSKTG